MNFVEIRILIHSSREIPTVYKEISQPPFIDFHDEDGGNWELACSKQHCCMAFAFLLWNSTQYIFEYNTTISTTTATLISTITPNYSTSGYSFYLLIIQIEPPASSNSVILLGLLIINVKY